MNSSNRLWRRIGILAQASRSSSQRKKLRRRANSESDDQMVTAVSPLCPRSANWHPIQFGRLYFYCRITIWRLLAAHERVKKDNAKTPKSAGPYSSPDQCPGQHRHLVAAFLSRLGTIAEVLLFDGTSAIHLGCVQRHRGTPHFPPGRRARRLSPLKGPELSHRLPE